MVRRSFGTFKKIKKSSLRSLKKEKSYRVKGKRGREKSEKSSPPRPTHHPKTVDAAAGIAEIVVAVGRTAAIRIAVP